jgi:hypothetical protein
MGERIFCRSLHVEDGRFFDSRGIVVGKVLEDGSIENTPYKFKHNEIRGGVAITTNSELVRQGGLLVNPATGEKFIPTKSGKGFFSKATMSFVKPYLMEKDGEG